MEQIFFGFYWEKNPRVQNNDIGKEVIYEKVTL